MNAFEKFITKIALLSGDGSYPIAPYGAFHLLFLAATIIACVLVVLFFRDISERAMRIVLTSVGFGLILFEVYKQLVFSYATTGEWIYQWFAFPFQFCSTPMYVMPFAGLLKSGKLRDMCMSYLSTFTLIAGLTVMLFVGGVFNTASVGVCVQTMVHHSAMVIVGVLVLANDRRKLGISYWLKSLPPFVLLFVMAFLMNIIVYHAGIPGVDMYYISPYTVTEGIFLVSDLKTWALDNNVYFLFPIVYMAAFALLALGAVYAGKGVALLGQKKRA